MINMKLLRSFRKNLKALKIQKKQYEQELMSLRVEIQEYRLAIDWIERNIKREKSIGDFRTKKQSRRSK